MKRLVIQTLLLSLWLPTAVALGQSCPNLPDMVDRILPSQVGDVAAMNALLHPTIASPQLSAAFNPRRAALALGDGRLALDRSSCDSPGEKRKRPFLRQLIARLGALLGIAEQEMENCTHTSPSSAEFRVREREGRYAYLNPARSHRGVEANMIDQRTAMDHVVQTLAAIGVPEAEIDMASSQVRDINLYAQDLGPGGPIGTPTVVRAEVYPMLLRHVGGTAVWDSFGSAAIDVRGEIARLHIRWPDFCIAPGVAASDTLSRRQVVDATVARIEANNPCDLISRLGTRLAYVETDAIDQPLTAGAGPEDADGRSNSCFLPAVIIAVFGPEPAPDSGQISLGAELIAVPLFAAGAADEPPPVPQ